MALAQQRAFEEPGLVQLKLQQYTPFEPFRKALTILTTIDLERLFAAKIIIFNVKSIIFSTTSIILNPKSIMFNTNRDTSATEISHRKRTDVTEKEPNQQRKEPLTRLFQSGIPALAVPDFFTCGVSL